MKEIENYDGYYVDEFGNIFSIKTGTLKKLAVYLDTKGKYLMVRLIRNDGVRKSLLVHRIVAQAYIPNPNNLPEVNHKDKNTKNPCAYNLEWCTRKENITDSYLTMSPVRNYNSCKLYRGNVLINSFQSISEAKRYAVKHFGASGSSLEKYLYWQDICIIADNGRKPKKL